MKEKTAKLPEDVKDIDELYRKMDREKRLELLCDYLETARYMKAKSDILFDHVASMACITAEEANEQKHLPHKYQSSKGSKAHS